MDEIRQSLDQPVTQTPCFPVIELKNAANKDTDSHFGKNSPNKTLSRNMASNHVALNEEETGRVSPEVSQLLAYPGGFQTQLSGCQPPVSGFSRNSGHLGRPNTSKTAILKNNNPSTVDRNLLLLSFNQNATNSDGATAEPYYMENFHDLASCSCDMDCFEPEEPPELRTFKRPVHFLPYVAPNKYRNYPPGSMLPKLHRNKFPQAWGIPTSLTKRAPNQTKYPLPTLTYPYTFMSQTIFKHYELHEKSDAHVHPD